VLRRRLDLPLTRDRDLRPLLSFELERRTPLAAADLHFAARVLARDRPRRRMTVEVVLAKRATVDAASTAIEAWAGRTPSVAAPAEQPGGWAPMLVERRTRSPASTRRRQLLAGLTCLATLLLIGLVLADAGRRAAETAALQAQLVAAEAAARATRDLQLKAATLAAERRFLPEQRRDRSAAAAIDAVARVPADRLIQAIDAAPEFTDARFAAPLIKVQNAASERFDITFRRRSGAPR
jgi:general secretion pathway protein L